MDIAGSVCVVTGGGNGIGAALARRFGTEAAGVVVVDLDGEGAERVASSLPEGRGLALAGDVTDAALHVEAVRLAEERFGPVDLYASNAGIGAGEGISASVETWDAVWRVNVLAHALAAKAVLPSMLERGQGWLLQTASAAGLLMNLGDAAYTATKHAAVGLAEWLSATYRHRGIGVSCLCPMGVDTDMLRRAADNATDGGLTGKVVTSAGVVLSPEEVAERVVETLAAERFLVLPHPEVSSFLSGKVADIDGWLAAMNRVQQKLEGSR